MRMYSETSLIQPPQNQEKLVELERWPEWTGPFQCVCNLRTEAWIREVALYRHMCMSVTCIVYILTWVTCWEVFITEKIANGLLF